MGLARSGRGGKGGRWRLRSVGSCGAGGDSCRSNFCRARGGRRAMPATAVKTRRQQHAPLTKDQAKELFRSVDEILAFVSTDTKLPI